MYAWCADVNGLYKGSFTNYIMRFFRFFTTYPSLVINGYIWAITYPPITLHTSSTSHPPLYMYLILLILIDLYLENWNNHSLMIFEVILLLYVCQEHFNIRWSIEIILSSNFFPDFVLMTLYISDYLPT